MRGDILFLCHRIPFPPDRGDKIRSYHLLERMAEVAPVHVGCLADDARDMGFAPDMAKLTASQCVLMRDRSRIMAGLKGLAKGQPLLVSLFDHPDLHRWVAKPRLNCRYASISPFPPLTLPNPVLPCKGPPRTSSVM